MSANTKIEWADHTFNAWEGCQKVGPGCDNCYAEARNARFSGGHAVNWGPGAPRRRTSAANWNLPKKWNAQAEAFYAEYGRRQRVFCSSLSDVFDNAVDPIWREDLFRLIEQTPNLDWLLLTKRIGNAREMMLAARGDHLPLLPNLWLGATIVNQEEADRDIPKLLETPAAKHFLSMEPLLGPVNLRHLNDDLETNELDALKPVQWEAEVENWRDTSETWEEDFFDWYGVSVDYATGPMHRALDWVIVGGESGPHARPMHPDWARSLRDQCNDAGVPFLFKQWGEWWEVESDRRDDETGNHWIVEADSIEAQERFDPKTDRLVAADGRVFSSIDWLPGDTPCRHVTRLGKKAAGRQLDGRTHDDFPI